MSNLRSIQAASRSLPLNGIPRRAGHKEAGANVHDVSDGNQHVDRPHPDARLQLSEKGARDLEASGHFSLGDAPVLAEPTNDVSSGDVDDAHTKKVAIGNIRVNPSNANSFVGRRVREERRRQKPKVTQEQLAAHLGISRPYLTQLETGVRAWSVEHMVMAAEFLGLDPGDLVAEREPVSVSPDEARILDALRAGDTSAAFLALSDAARKK